MSDERWSHSRIGTFEQCPRKYEYKYVEHRREAFDSIDGFMGARVHDTIEWLYASRQQGWEPNLANTLQAYDRSWEFALHDGYPTSVRPDKSVVSYVAEGHAMIEKFYPRFVADPLHTLGIEVEVACDVVYRPNPTSHQTFQYRGFVDRLANANIPPVFEGTQLCVIDYKTTRHVPRKFEGKEADQLRSYALCLMLSDANIDNVYLIADFVRTGEQRTQLVNRDNMPTIAAQLGRRIASAAAARQFPAIPSKLCDWCGYNDVCKARETGEGSPF